MASQKRYYYIVTGSLVLSVNAKSQDEGLRTAKNYLEENSPLRDWELYTDILGVRDVDVADIKL